MTRGTGAFFSEGAALDLALAANARTNGRTEMSDRKNMITKSTEKRRRCKETRGHELASAKLRI